MKITFLGQGFESESKKSVGNTIIQLFKENKFSSFTGISAFGCTSRLTSRTPCRYSRSQRITFMPPPVEPAQPPIKLVKISMTGNAPGHIENSAVAKPVVVATDTT